MKDKERKNKPVIQNTQLRDDELANSGVGKILFEENRVLKNEVTSLKMSLKVSQDELEKLRTHNHELDKKNSIMEYKLTTSFLPEFLKFIASSICAGAAVNFFFTNQIFLATISLVVSIFVYGGILFLYRK